MINGQPSCTVIHTSTGIKAKAMQQSVRLVDIVGRLGQGISFYAAPYTEAPEAN